MEAILDNSWISWGSDSLAAPGKPSRGASSFVRRGFRLTYKSTIRIPFIRSIMLSFGILMTSYHC